MKKLRLRTFHMVLISAALIGADAQASEQAKLDSTRVNFKAQDLQLREALQSLAAQADLQIVFNDADVRDLKVSCICNDVLLHDALETLLKPTHLTFEVMKDGQIVIVRRRVNLKGYVKAAESGENLPYANVTLKGTSRGTASNVNGYFVLVNEPAGLCTLRVSYIGYQLTELPLMLNDGHETITIKMKPQVLHGTQVAVTGDNLQTMEVAHNPSELRVAPLQISRLPAIGELDVFGSLQLLPGIGGVSDISTGLYVRGGTPDQNLVLFDGMTIYHVDHFFGFSSAFNTDAIKDVRVFKGGFPAKFGGRISSIVELTGKTGSYDKFQAGASVNLLSGSGMVQVPISGRAAWLISFRRSYTDVIKSNLYKDIYNFITRPSRPNGPGNASQPATVTPDFYYYDLISKLSYSLSVSDVLSLSFYNSQDRLDQLQGLSSPGHDHNAPEADSSAAPAATGDVTKWGNLGVSGKWSRLWNDRCYSSFSGAYSVYSSDSRGAFARGGGQGTMGSHEANNVKDVSLQWGNELQASKSHKFEFGLDFNHTDVSVSFTANDTLHYLQRDDKATQAALYLQDAWKPLAPFELTLGVRAIHYAPTEKNYLEPRVSFKFSLDDHLSLKGAYGEYHQFVNRITNDDALNGNRDFWLLAGERLAPNFAEHKILGLTYENRHFLFDIEAYHKNLEGVAEFSQRFHRPPGSPAEELFFLGDGAAQGIEFMAQKKIGKLNGWASYTLAEVEYRIPELNGGEAFPAKQDRRHEVKLVGNYCLAKWNFAATWVLNSGAPYTAPVSGGAGMLGDKNANRLPAYHRFDISCSRQFTFTDLNWEVGLSIFNLYDRRNVLRREFVLNANSVSVRDLTTLGLTPTVTLRVNLK